MLLEEVTGREKRVEWEKELRGLATEHGEAVDSGHPSKEARQHGIESSHSEGR